VAGREFNSSDRADTLPVVMVSDSFARRHFPGEDPIGRRLKRSTADGASWQTVVGVVADVMDSGLGEATGPTLYQPYAQNSVAGVTLAPLTLVVRTVGDPRSVAPAVRAAIAAVDRDLPVVHGDRVCREVAGSGPRILMLTAAGDVEDRVDGLELGADDYLGKPFAFAELVARVRALSRRAPSAPPIMRRGDLTVDRARHRASRGSRPLSLTRKEFGILEMLLAADGAVVSAEDMLEHVWDAHADPFSNIVSVTMARLRRKLGDPPLIETVVGVGYRL
jgi:DNA-binding response OmpR family regulator